MIEISFAGFALWYIRLDLLYKHVLWKLRDGYEISFDEGDK